MVHRDAARVSATRRCIRLRLASKSHVTPTRWNPLSLSAHDEAEDAQSRHPEVFRRISGGEDGWLSETPRGTNVMTNSRCPRLHICALSMTPKCSRFSHLSSPRKRSHSPAIKII